MQEPNPTVPDRQSPRTWLLLGHKAGDNAQVLALAQTLGWPYESKRLVYRRSELLTNRWPGGSLAGINRRKSSPLTPPWPDLVIASGRRNEPVARWIRRQADSQVRLVHIGRPYAPLECFDLIITTPQYALPAQPNVLHNLLPLHPVTQDRLAAAAALWQPRLAALPQPRIAVLVGGHSHVYVFNPEEARRLGQMASRLANTAGGSLLVTTSARTPPSSSTALAEAIGAPAYCHQWAPGQSDNPYLAYLGLADAFIVTADSISMLAEACATTKPVYIFDDGNAASPVGRSLYPWWRRWRRWRYQVILNRLALRLGPVRLRRDIGALQHLLVSSGRAAWLGQPFPPGPPPPPPEDLPRAVARVWALFDW